MGITNGSPSTVLTGAAAAAAGPELPDPDSTAAVCEPPPFSLSSPLAAVARDPSCPTMQISRLCVVSAIVDFGTQSGGVVGNRSWSKETDVVEIGMTTAGAITARCRCRFQSSMMPA